MQLKPGTLLQGGKYRIEKVLGQGGFGITYLAVQTNLKNRKVAIKEFFLKEHCERDGSTSRVSMGTSGSQRLVMKFKEKFVKEAETISELRNHHIITIYDVFEENGTAYYVMEYLSYGSLSDRIPSGGLPESEAVGYIRQVAEALAYIHQHNILHLDVKPSNILFRKEDEAVLIDFGISKHYDDEGGSQTSSTPVGVSEGYAPTEQYEREGVSSFFASTDIYSLGATLYCLLSGHRPPKASIVLNDGLPPLPSSVSASTRVAVETAMSPKRKDRPQSVEAFLELLDAPVVEESEETTVVPDVNPEVQEVSSPKRSFKWLLIFVTLTLLTVTAVGVIFFVVFDRKGMASDLEWYNYYMAKGDSLSCDNSTLSQAQLAYQFADTIAFMDLEDSLLSDKANEKIRFIQDKIQNIRSQEAYYLDGSLVVKGIQYPMVYVCGGSFDMGATSEQGSDVYTDEKPVHRVTLSSYSIGKYEVTQELWEAVMGSNPSYHKGSRRPVDEVSWDDCQDFIRKLNELTGANFRLPTEAEWEFAARGGNSSRGYKYSGSDTLDNVAWYYDNSESETHDVGTKSSNELGLYDMSGNVWEWCNDRYGSYSSSSQTNPKGGSSYRRVFRGGCWGSRAGGVVSPSVATAFLTSAAAL